MGEREFDVVVIGAGAAGEVAAGRLGSRGVSVAIVEEHLVGGECSFYACMPSKALLRPLEVRNEALRVHGVDVGSLDPSAILRRRDQVIANLDDSSQLTWLEQRNVELVRGHGRLDGEGRVAVGDDVLLARTAVILATGSTALIPNVPGLRAARPWGNREATIAPAAPARLIVLGGGSVAVELAQAWASLGSRVTIVHRGERLLKREEPFAGEQVRQGLVETGVELRLGQTVTRVDRNGVVRATLDDGAILEAEEILVATGRVPATWDVGVETLGLEPGSPVEVDDTLRVLGHPWLFAVGDVNGRALLTHMGKYQGRLVADTIEGREARVRSDGSLSPRTIFTDPQVGAVGHTLASAQQAGLDVRAVDVGTSANAGGSFVGRGAPGTARIVIDEGRRVIVGATITGSEVAEALHAATIAVVAEVTLDDLWHAVPSFPTRSELWLRLLEAYGL